MTGLEKQTKKEGKGKNDHPIKAFRNAENGGGATRLAVQASETLVMRPAGSLASLEQ